MSALTAQLSRLQNRTGGVHTALVDKSRAAATGVRVVPTILFNPHEARNITREQLLELALVGLRSLVAIDNRLARPAAFLFSDAHTRKERSMFTTSESEKVVSPAVHDFLALLAPHIMEPAALQVLEYLIRVFEIHEYDALALLKAILPAHDQGLFVRVLFLLNLQGTGFEFLRTNKQSGTILPRAALVTAARENPRVLDTICDIAKTSLQKNITHPASLSLFSFVISSIATSSTHDSNNNEQIFRAVLPILVDWLPRATSHPDHSAAAQFVLFVWSNESRFSVDIIRVVFSSLCKLCRSNSNNNHSEQEQDDNDDNNRVLLDAYRLLGHLFNSQRAIITASATASTSTGADNQLQANLVAQIVNLPFNRRALSSFAKVSPWGFSLVLKHCFEADSDSQESAFEYIEQCLESNLPLGQAHIQQVLIELAQVFAVVSTTTTTNDANSNNNNSREFVYSFCDRAVRLLERRFSKAFDLALAELLKVEANFESKNKNTNNQVNQENNNNNDDTNIMTAFVLKYCTGSKYELVDVQSSNSKLPLIGALVHPVAGVRRLAASQLRGGGENNNNNKKKGSSASSSSATFTELLSLVEHVIKTETDIQVLKELFSAIATHSRNAFETLSALDDEEQGDHNNNNNTEDDAAALVGSSSSSSQHQGLNPNNTANKNKNKLLIVLFESIRALMRFFPTTIDHLNEPSNQSRTDVKSKFLSLCETFAGVFSSSSPSSSSLMTSFLETLSISATLSVQQVDSALFSSSEKTKDGTNFLNQVCSILGSGNKNNNKNKTASSNSNESNKSELSFWLNLFSNNNKSTSTTTTSSSGFETFAFEIWNARPSPINDKNQQQNQQQSSVSSSGTQHQISALVDAALFQVGIFSVLNANSAANEDSSQQKISLLSSILNKKIFPHCSNNNTNSNKQQQAQQSNSLHHTAFRFITKTISLPLSAFLLSFSASSSSSSQQVQQQKQMEVASLILTSSAISRDDSALSELFEQSLQLVVNNNNTNSTNTQQSTTAVSPFSSIVLLFASSVEQITSSSSNQQQQQQVPLINSVRNATQLFKSLGKVFNSKNNNNKTSSIDDSQKLLLSLVLVALLSSLQSTRSTSSSLAGGVGSSSHQLHMAFNNAAKELASGLQGTLANSNSNNASSSSQQQQQQLRLFASRIIQPSLQQISGLGEGETQNNNSNTSSAAADEKELFEGLLTNIIFPQLVLSSSSSGSSLTTKKTTAIPKKSKDDDIINKKNYASALSSLAPSLYSCCLNLITTAAIKTNNNNAASSQNNKKKGGQDNSIGTMLAASVSPLIQTCNDDNQASQPHSPLPIQSLIQLASALGVANTIIPAFFEESLVASPIKVCSSLMITENNGSSDFSNNNNKSIVSAFGDNNNIVPKFAGEFVMHQVAQYFEENFVEKNSTATNTNKTEKTQFASTLLALQRRGCKGVSACFAKNASLFEVLVQDILVPFIKDLSSQKTQASDNNKNKSLMMTNMTAASECVKFTLQEKTAIESLLQSNPSSTTRLTSASLTAAETCVRAALAISSSSTTTMKSKTELQLTRSTLLSTASSCLEFCVNYKASLASDDLLFFFLSSSPTSSTTLLGGWAPLVLANDASTVHATIALIDSAVILALSSKNKTIRDKLSIESLNLLAAVVVGAFAENNDKNKQEDSSAAASGLAVLGTGRYSATAAVQKLMKSLLPALMKSSSRNGKADNIDDYRDEDLDVDEDVVNNNNIDENSSDDDNEDAPPVIFSRNKNTVLSKYNKKNDKNNKNQEQQQKCKTPEELREIATKRRNRILELFEKAKTNLALPLISLLIKMRDVASASQLQFKSPDSVLTDIVCSFDIIDQMACYRGILEVWLESMSHPQGFVSMTTTTTSSNSDDAAVKSSQEEQLLLSPVQKQMANTDLRPFAKPIASFLKSWVEDSRFIDSFVVANTAAVVEALREQTERGGGGSSLLSLVRTAPTLAPFCDSIFSAMALFQQYKMRSLQENEKQFDENQGQDDDDDEEEDNQQNGNKNNNDKKSKRVVNNNWYVSLIGSVVATMLSMVDEELFVICIREITLMSSILKKAASAAATHHANNNNNNNQTSSSVMMLNKKSAAVIASRRIGLEILCDRLALSTTLGGSSARYTSRNERIARGATAVLSERVSQRILELLHRLLRELTVSVHVVSESDYRTTSLDKASKTFTNSNVMNLMIQEKKLKQQQKQEEHEKQLQQQQQKESGARRDRAAEDDASSKNKKKTSANNKSTFDTTLSDDENGNNKKNVIDDDDDDDKDEEEILRAAAIAEGNNSYRGLLRRNLLSVPREHILDVQWVVMCCEESARCFGAVTGDQFGLLIGTLARIGLDAICFRGRVFPTVPTYRGVEFVASCAWKDIDDENDEGNKNNNTSAVVLPQTIDSSQLVLISSISTAASILASTLGASRMISASGNDILNLLTTSIRYSARMSHQLILLNNSNNSTNTFTPETREALRQLRSISLDSLRRSLPSAWTLVEPFLPHIISSVTSHSIADDAETSASSRELLGELDALLEPRVLFPCIAEALQQSFPDTHSFALLFQVVQNLISRLSKTEVKQITTLMNCELFTVAFDKFADQKPLAHIDTLRASFSAFASLIVKFRESTSKNLCSNVVVWGTSTKRSAKQTAPRAQEVQCWTICLSLFEYIVERLGEVSDFIFPVVSPVIVDVISTLSTTSSSPLSVQQYILKNAAQEATSCLDSAFACIRRIADVANEASEKTNTATDSPDTPEALLPYFARSGPFEALRDPLSDQIGNITLLSDYKMDYSSRAQEVLIPCLRSLYKSLRNPKLWSEMQQALLKNLRQPSSKARLTVLSLLRVIYADGGDTLASLVLAEALPSIVEATEDMDANVAEEARLLCRELSTITGQDVLEYMTA